MAQFSVNPHRFDPYKNFKFRVKWDGRYVAGISKVGGLKRTTEVVKHREGGDPSSSRKSPGKTPREAYLVKCDSETTTQADVNLGIVNIIVGFAPLKPAEFVIIKLEQLAGQVQV